MNEISLNELSFERFQSLLNTPFRVGADPACGVQLELVEATRYRRSPPATAATTGPVFEQFSLVFIGPAEQPLPQAMHSFTHDQVGLFQLFIVPIRLDQGKLYYEAVFNRRIAVP
jgi:hypothetical protein